MTSPPVTTHLVPTQGGTPRQVASLTEAEELALLRRHGALLWAALVAFGSDPDYLCDIVEAANKNDGRVTKYRSTVRAKRAAQDDA